MTTTTHSHSHWTENGGMSMQRVNLDHGAVVAPGGVCAYSAATGAPIANTLNRSSWARFGDALLLPREQLPEFPASLELEPAQIAALPTCEEAIFLAWPIWADGHWGHFLVEEVALLWLVLGPQRLAGVSTLILPSYARSRIASLRDLLETHLSLRFTDELTDHLLVKRLWSPVPSMFEGGPVHSSHFQHVLDVLQALDPSLLPPDHPDWHDASLPRRVYLSRSGLPASARHVEAEQELEYLLEQFGWHVIHPQNLPLQQQIRYLINAQEIAGPLGSAFHTLMVLGSCDCISSKRVTILSSPALRCLESTFRAQLDAQSIPFRFFECMQLCPGQATAAQQPWDSNYRFSLDLPDIVDVIASSNPVPALAGLSSRDRLVSLSGFAPRISDDRAALALINANRAFLLVGRG